MKAFFVAFVVAASLFVPAAAASPPKLEYLPSCAGPGAPATARCGVLHVDEDGKTGGRLIPLHFAVVPGEAERTRDPIVMISGGPGQGSLQLMPQLLGQLRSVDKKRDIVFVDQRGTGSSNPLSCPAGFDLLVASGSDPRLSACIAMLKAQADLDQYSSSKAAQDLEELRRALGYERVNLVASSYGVRVAALYMRQHPASVRTAVLRAAYPLDFNIISDGLGNADAELGRILDQCQAEMKCRGAYPNLEDQLRRLSDRLEQRPEMVTATSARGHEQIFVTKPLFQQLLYAMMLMTPTRQQVPLLIATAEKSGFQAFAPLILQVRSALFGALPVGMYLSVICSEDAPRLRRGSFKAGRTPLASMGPTLARACATWPVQSAPKAQFNQKMTTTPVVVVSGTLDPATTTEAADWLVRSLPNSRHIVVPATAHGPLFPYCVKEAVSKFLSTGLSSEANAKCPSMPLPPFEIPMKPDQLSSSGG